ncbi:MAG: NAD-dependent epimerase/dehydratase family protein [Bacteroidales bacterium]|nr:NAD-dependent epimerase/dehydratase family protein [Bacteroidales bacterium]
MINESDDMKVLVTGATGFIGRYVVNELLSSGCHIIATSRNQDKARSYKWYSRVQYIPCDLNEASENFFQFFQRPDLLIHLAWEGLPNYTDLFHLEKNLFSNYRFLKNMVEHGLKSMLVAGTCFEYGMQSGALKETMITIPNNPYGLAKDTLRKFLEQLQQKYRFLFKWLRLFYIYGESQSEQSLLSQLEKAIRKGKKRFNMSGGEQVRDYLPVEKVAEYIVKISMQNKVSGIINCCSGVPVSIRKLVEDYLEKKQKSIHLNLGYYSYPDYEPMAFWGCDKKLQIALKEGL